MYEIDVAMETIWGTRAEMCYVNFLGDITT